MEKPVFSTNTLPRIALIIPYIGPLPSYFPMWLESAKANPDVDFFFYTDQDVEIAAPNFRVTKTTLEALQKRFSKKLGRPVPLPRPYKLCDYKPCYGLFFEEELRGYDFWGYCDIDMVFGQIRRFLTSELLSRYDRLYSYGMMCIYRNNEKMRRLFELPGSVYTLDDLFGEFHIAADEYAGINRICVKNNISWYVDIDYAILNFNLKDRMEMLHTRENYPVQAFYWLDGRAFQRYEDGGQIKDRELAFIHYAQKPSVLEGLPAPGEALVVTQEKLLVRPMSALTRENMAVWNPVYDASKTKKEWALTAWKRRIRRTTRVLKASPALKKLYLKELRFWLLEMKLTHPPYP